MVVASLKANTVFVHIIRNADNKSKNYLRIDSDGDTDDAKRVPDHREDVVTELLFGAEGIEAGFGHDHATNFQVDQRFQRARLILQSLETIERKI